MIPGHDTNHCQRILSHSSQCVTWIRAASTRYPDGGNDNEAILRQESEIDRYTYVIDMMTRFVFEFLTMNSMN